MAEAFLQHPRMEHKCMGGKINIFFSARSLQTIKDSLVEILCIPIKWSVKIYFCDGYKRSDASLEAISKMTVMHYNTEKPSYVANKEYFKISVLF